MRRDQNNKALNIHCHKNYQLQDQPDNKHIQYMGSPDERIYQYSIEIESPPNKHCKHCDGAPTCSTLQAAGRVFEVKSPVKPKNDAGQYLSAITGGQFTRPFTQAYSSVGLEVDEFVAYRCGLGDDPLATCSKGRLARTKRVNVQPISR